MGDISARNFGILIAYVLPGFVALWGLGYLSETVHGWLVGVGTSGPSVGGFLYVFLGSIACGMTAAAFRWAFLDTLLHATGLRKPVLDFSKLKEREEAFERVVEYHYHFYQFYGNTLVSLLLAYPLWRGVAGGGGPLTDCAFLLIEAVFAAGSRDALRLFYRRASQLLGENPEVSDDERRWWWQARSGPCGKGNDAQEHEDPETPGHGGSKPGDEDAPDKA